MEIIKKGIHVVEFENGIENFYPFVITSEFKHTKQFIGMHSRIPYNFTESHNINDINPSNSSEKAIEDLDRWILWQNNWEKDKANNKIKVTYNIEL